MTNEEPAARTSDLPPWPLVSGFGPATGGQASSFTRHSAIRASSLSPPPTSRGARSKSHANRAEKSLNASGSLHNIVAKTRVLRGKTGAVIAHFRAKSGKNRGKTGRFAPQMDLSRPQNPPGALEMRLRPSKNAPKIRPPPKKIFWIFSAIALPLSPCGLWRTGRAMADKLVHWRASRQCHPRRKRHAVAWATG